MLFDIAYALGGNFLVSLFDAILGPLFDLVCSLGTAWEPVATFFEIILS